MSKAAGGRQATDARLGLTYEVGGGRSAGQSARYVYLKRCEAMQIDLKNFVHSEYHQFLDLLQASAERVVTVDTLPTIRSEQNPLSRPPLASPVWTQQTIPGPKGAPDVEILVINAGQKSSPRPAILHTHGGGFVVGSAKGFLFHLQEIAAALDCVIVSVDYRLAPETPFPGALEDNYAGLKWLFDHAEEMGADRSRIALLGESAGGGHAAMLAIAARDRGEISPIYQALMYPMLDDRTGTTTTVPPHIGAVIWRPDQNRFGWTSLLGKPAGSPDVPYGAVPSRIDDLRGLPPTFISVGSLDLSWTKIWNTSGV